MTSRADGGVAPMRRQHDVVQREQLCLDLRLPLEDVERRADDPTLARPGRRRETQTRPIGGAYDEGPSGRFRLAA
jgi:hypothetical protein